LLRIKPQELSHLIGRGANGAEGGGFRLRLVVAGNRVVLAEIEGWEYGRGQASLQANVVVGSYHPACRNPLDEISTGANSEFCTFFDCVRVSERLT
jgi:hypothetical protein